MKGIQECKGHSHPGECRWMDKSGHGRNLSEQGALTSWRAQTDRQASKDMEGNRASKGHSHPGEYRWMDKSGHGRNPSEQGALTSWRAQTDRQVRTWKESE